MSTPYYRDDHVTLYHGDCLEHPEWWTDADVLVTDPPYGVPGGRVGSHYGKRAQVHPDAAWDSLDARNAALDLWGDRPRAVFGSPLAHSPGHRGVPVIWEKGDDPGMGDPAWPFGPSYEVIWIAGEGWRGKRRSSILRSPRLTSDARTTTTRQGRCAVVCASAATHSLGALKPTRRSSSAWPHTSVWTCPATPMSCSTSRTAPGASYE